MKIGNNFEIDLGSGKRVFIATLVYGLLYKAMMIPDLDATIRGVIVAMALSITTWYFATHKSEPTV